MEPEIDAAALSELADAWWAVHRSDALLDPERGSEEDWDRYFSVTERVEELSLDLSRSPRLILALVNATPPEEDAAYVGTWVLEDANATLAKEEIATALAESELTPAEAEKVSSGWNRR